MTTFYICRHGKTEYNVQKRLQGQIDTPLTEEGIQNAHELAKKLAGVNLSGIISSDLGRAFITAYIISVDLKHQKEIIRTAFLREVSFGDLAGLLIKEAEGRYPQLQINTTYAPPNGESLEQLQTRVTNFLLEFSKDKGGQTFLLVTHDVVINAIFTKFKEIEFGSYNKEHYNEHDFVGKFLVNSGQLVSFEEI